MGEIILGGRYVIENEIGSGGMAIVYKALDKMLNRTVAIKVLRPEFKQDEEFIKRFDTEAKSAAGLNHPNIVAIYDVGIHEGLRYIVMEYVKGETLKDVIRRWGKLPWNQALDFAKKICSALSHAHGCKIIHRDIKPHNIMVTEDGSLKVMDFGIARATSASTMTMGAKVLGSAHYLSPEQARGGFTDERSDLYSLGVCLYEMVTGKVPFDAESTIAVAMQHLQKDPPSPKEIVPDLPDSVEHIILKAMKKEQSQRYLAAAAMEADIVSAMANPGVIPQEKNNEAFYTTRQLDIITDAEIKNKPSKKKKKDKGLIALLVSLGILVAIALAFWIVFVRVTGKSEDKKVPNLLGLTKEEAEEVVEGLEEEFDLELMITTKEAVSSMEDRGKIIAQNPEKNEKFDPSGIIEVTLGKGPEEVTLGRFIGYDMEKAIEEVENLGLRYKIETEDEDDNNEKFEAGTVTRQDPASGTVLKAGSIVTLYESKGTEGLDPKVPDMIGLDAEKAIEKLQEQGFSYYQEIEEESEERAGTVIRQNPEGEKRADVDEVITLYIAKEKEVDPSIPTKRELKFTVPESDYEIVAVKVIKSNGDTVYRGNHKPSEEVIVYVMLKADETEKYEIWVNEKFCEEKKVQGR